MATAKVQVILDAKDNASKVIKNIASEFKNAGKTLGDMGSSLTKNITVPVAAATTAFALMAKQGAKVLDIEGAFGGLAKSIGRSSEDILSSIREATFGTISDVDIMTQFLRASSLIGQEALGESGENFAEFAQIAIKAAKNTGQSVDYMFESIVLGLGRGSKMILDNTGIIVDAQGGYEAYAESIGKSVKQLTEQEKKVALTNQFLAQANSTLGHVAVSTDDASVKFGQMEAKMKNAKDQMAASLTPAFLNLVEAVQPLVNQWIPPLIDGITDLVTKFGELSPDVQKTALGFLMFATVLGPFLTILSKVAKAFVPIKLLGKGLKTLFALKGLKIGDAFLVLRVALLDLAKYFGILKTAVGAFFTFLMAHPVILIIAGIIAVITLLVVAWKKNWGDIQGKTKAVMDFLKVKFEQTKNSISDFVDNAKTSWKNFTTGIKNLPKNISKAFGSMVSTIKQKGADIKQAIQSTFAVLFGGQSSDFNLEAIEEVFGTAFARAMNVANTTVVGFIENIKTTFIDFKNAVVEFFTWDNLMEVWYNMWFNFGEAVGKAFRFITETIPQFTTQLIEAILAFGTTLLENFTLFLTQIGELFVNFFTVIIPEAWNSLVTFFTETVPALAVQFVGWITGMLIGAWKAFVNFCTVTVPTAIRALINFLRVEIPALAKQFVQWIIEMGAKTVQAISDMKDWVIQLIIDLKQNAITWVIQLWRDFTTWISNLVATVINTMWNLPGNIAAAMQSVYNTAVSKAKEIYDGVKGWFDKIVGFFNNIISKAGEAINKAKEAFSLGFRSGASKQTGGIVPGPIGSAVPITAHAGERIIPARMAKSGSGSSGGGLTFNVTVGLYTGSETEKRNIARELYAALVQVAQSQNKTVQELMGA